MWTQVRHWVELSTQTQPILKRHHLSDEIFWKILKNTWQNIRFQSEVPLNPKIWVSSGPNGRTWMWTCPLKSAPTEIIRSKAAVIGLEFYIEPKHKNALHQHLRVTLPQTH